MKVRKEIGALSFLVFATAICVFRVSQQQSQAQAPATEGAYTAKQKKVQKFREKLKYDLEHNFRARENNGSQRAGVELEQLPDEVRKEAKQLADEYRNVIYPALKKWLDNHETLPEAVEVSIPKLKPLIAGEQATPDGWKPFGPGQWAIGRSRRMDGTIVARDVYSKNPPDAPHDTWASNLKFQHVPKFMQGFTINGWDDGKVTFDFLKQNLYDPKSGRLAVSGQAGILTEVDQSLRQWRTEQDAKEKAAKEKAAKEEAKTGEAPKDASADTLKEAIKAQ